jgi:hypothetical protein
MTIDAAQNVAFANPVTFSGNIDANGNLNFIGTGRRITGDMSNATLSNRLFFQNSVTNGNTDVAAIPNGTGSAANFTAFGSSSDQANTTLMRMGVDATTTFLNSFRTGTGSYLPLTFSTGGSERMRLDTSGNVGIGTASPGSLLDVAGVIRSTSASAPFLNLIHGSTDMGGIYSPDTSTVNLLARASKSLVFMAGGATERMRITSTGNVGIGTASPGTKLYVIGAITADGSGTATEELLVSNADGGFTNTAAIALRRSGTNMGKIDADYFQGMRFYVTNGAGAAATERMRINSSGNVGIGTTSPSTALQVNGTITTTGLTVSNTIAGSINGTSNYCNNTTQGFNSNWNTDFAAAPAGSTILRGDTATGSTTGGPGGTWWFQQNMRHTNASNVWGVQVAWGWEDNANILRTRNVQGGSYGAWVTYLNSANYTSYITGSSLKSQTFTGSGTFTVPAGITSVWVTMVGGGGSGGSNASSSGSSGGGGGAYCLKRAVSVTPGAGVAVTIGGGGGGVNNSDGNDGGASSFGSVSVSGGLGGPCQSTFSMGGAGGGNGGVAIGTNNASGRNPYPATGPGGRGGKSDTTTYWGAFSGGGGGLFGDGTNGSNNNSASAGANTGAGSGGASNGAWSSGNGGSGMVIVEWLG